MRVATTEVWGCGDCGAEVSAEVLFAYCDGCSKPLCVACLEVAHPCEDCELLSCRSCSLRLFAVECPGCAMPLHVACVERRGGKGAHPLCDRCGEQAKRMWA